MPTPPSAGCFSSFLVGLQGTGRLFCLFALACVRISCTAFFVGKAASMTLLCATLVACRLQSGIAYWDGIAYAQAAAGGTIGF